MLFYLKSLKVGDIVLDPAAETYELLVIFWDHRYFLLVRGDKHLGALKIVKWASYFLVRGKEYGKSVAGFSGNLHHYVVFLLDCTDFFVDVEVQVEFSLFEPAFYFENMNAVFAPDMERYIVLDKLHLIHWGLESKFESNICQIKNILIHNKIHLILEYC